MMEWAWLIPSLPAIAFAFMATLGRRLPTWTAIAATGSMGVSFVLFFFVFADWFGEKSFLAQLRCSSTASTGSVPATPS